LGSEEETKGEILRWFPSASNPNGITGLAGDSVSSKLLRIAKWEVLLRMTLVWDSSFCRWLREKKDVFEAVIGVLGVFALLRWLGGVSGRSLVAASFSFIVLIFAAVGVLNGNKFRGGSRNGCRPFLRSFDGCF
jgi:hypothetical protein